MDNLCRAKNTYFLLKKKVGKENSMSGTGQGNRPAFLLKKKGKKKIISGWKGICYLRGGTGSDKPSSIYKEGKEILHTAGKGFAIKRRR